MAIDELIEALAAEGRVDSEGDFTLDRAKAREKTRKFQLAEPLHYLLELVQAAVARGATGLTFRIDTDDMWLEYDGRPWTMADVDGLYDALLSARATLEDRRCLAIGLNSAMALNPAHIRLESGAVQLEMRPDRADTFGPLDPPRDGTRIHVRDQLSPSQVLVFFRSLFGQLAEIEVLASRCGHAQIPIVINGVPLAASGRAELAYETAFEHANGAGVVGFDPKGGQGEVLIVTHGVWIARQPLPTAGLRAHVHAVGLTKDASRFAFVEDAAFLALSAAMDAAHDRATAKVVRDAVAADLDPDDWRTHMAHARLERDEGPFAELGQRVAPALAAALGALPFADDLSGARVSLAALAARIERWSRLAFTADATLAAVSLPGDEPVLLLPEAVDRERLRARFDPHLLANVTEALRAVEARRRRRAAWRARPAKPTLAEGRFLRREPFEVPGVRGEIGARVLAGATTSLALVIDDHAYAQQRSDLGLPGLEVSLAAALTPDEGLVWIEADEVAGQALCAVATVIEGFFQRLAAQAEWGATQGLLRGWLELRWGGGWPAALRDLFAWPEGQPLPVELTAAPPPALGALVRVPLLRTTRGETDWADLHAVQTRLAADGAIAWVPAERTPLPGLAPWMLRLDDADRLLLASLVGDDALEGGAEAYEQAERAAVFSAQAATGPQVDGAVASVRFTDPDGITGQIGFTAVQQSEIHAGGPSSRVRVFHEGRPIDTLSVTLPIGPLVGAVQVPGAQPKADWTGVHRSAELVHRVALALTRAVPTLLSHLVAHDRLRAVHLGRSVVQALYPFHPLRPAADTLRRQHGPVEAERRYRALLDRAWSLGPLAPARLAALVAEGTVPTPEALDGTDDARRIALLHTLIGPAFGGDPARPMLARLVEATPGLAQAPALRDPAGRWLSFGALMAGLEADQTCVVCPRDTPDEPGRIGLWFADPEVEQAVALLILGPGRLIGLAAWSRQVALDRAYRARPQRGLDLPRGRTCATLRFEGGVVGLWHPHPSRGAARLELLVRGRHVRTIDVDLPARVHAAVAVDEAVLSLEQGVLRVDEASVAWAIKQVARRLAALLAGLADDWPLDAKQGTSARAHALEAIARNPEGRAAARLEATPLLPRLAARPASLHGLRRHLEAGRVACVCRPGDPAESLDEEGDWVLVLTDALAERLEALVGGLPTYTQRRRELDRLRSFEAKATVPARLDDRLPLLARHEIGWRGLTGEVGLRADVAATPHDLNGHPVPTQVLHQGRPLCEVLLWSPLRGLVAVFESDALQPNEAFDGLLERGPLTRVQQAVNAAARKLPYRSRVAERRTLGPLVLDLVRLTYPTPTFREVHSRLRARMRPDRADAAYEALLEAARRRDVYLAEQTLRAHLAADRPLSRASLDGLPTLDDGEDRVQIVERISGRPLGGASTSDIAARVIGSLPGASKVPIAQTRDGTPITAAALLERVATDGVALYGEGPVVADRLVLGEVDHVALSCLLGDALITVSTYHLGLRRAALIDALPRLPALADARAVPVQHRIAEGTVGLSTSPALRGAYVGLRGRQVAHLPLNEGLPLVAVLDHASDLPLQWRGETLVGLVDPEGALDTVRRAAQGLVAAFARQASGLPAEVRAAFYPAAVQALAAWAPGCLGDQGRLPEGLRPLIEVPGLLDLAGRRVSLETLRRGAEAPIWLVDAEAPTVPGVPGPVIRAEPALARALRALLPRVLDGADRVARRQVALRVRAGRPLPEPPADAWATRRIGGGGLKGWIWLPRSGANTLALGADGGEVCRVASGGVAPVPFSGAVRGSAVGDDPFRPEARLSQRGLQTLRRAVAALYDGLVDAYLEGAVAPADVAPLTQMLRDTAVALARDEAEVPVRLRQSLLAARLFDVPGDGRRALQELLASRPAAWAHLGLWSAAPDRVAVETPRPAAEAGSPPTVVPEPLPAPVERSAPEPPAQPADPSAALLAQLQHLLRLIREADEALFEDVNLDRLAVSILDGRAPVRCDEDGAVVFDAQHPLVARAVASPSPARLGLLASVAFGALVEGHPREARVEAAFMERLLARVAADVAP